MFVLVEFFSVTSQHVKQVWVLRWQILQGIKDLKLTIILLGGQLCSPWEDPGTGGCGFMGDCRGGDGDVACAADCLLFVKYSVGIEYQTLFSLYSIIPQLMISKWAELKGVEEKKVLFWSS